MCGYYLVLLGACTLLCHIARALGPPTLTENRIQENKLVKLGEPTRLTCPVEGNPDLLIRWTKDGESIDHGWERFKTSKDGYSLRIKDVMMEDAGVYICKAINGFGSIDVQFILHVTNENDTLTNLESNFFPSVIDNEGNKPRFTAPAKNRRRNIQRPVGSSARLRCKATGKPKPEIIWYKDNKQIVEERNSNDHVHTQKWTLHLSDLRNEDSGKYTCRVYNRAGMINYTYTVEVIEKIKMKPELIPPHPVNMTVKYGGMAQFQCRVRSDSEPTIKWLKQVSTKSTTQLNNTIKVDNQLFAVLKTGDVWSRKDGTFLNKLVITNARMADAGMYICLGANTLGYSFRQAFLTVNISDSQLLKEKNARSSSSHSGFNPTTLTLVIAIPSACVIFFVITTVYILHRKHTCMASSSQKLTVTVTRTPKHNISANHLDKDQFRPLKSQSPHGYSQKRSETPYSESPYSEQYDGVPYSVSEVQYGSDRQYRDYPEVAHPSHAGVYLAPGSISDYPDLQSNPGDYRHTNSIASDYREINSGRSDLSSLPRLGNNHHNNYLNA